MTAKRLSWKSATWFRSFLKYAKHGIRFCGNYAHRDITGVEFPLYENRHTRCRRV